jgi:prepilin signal peptidase PulO-like enzyme (type II secretory pathway)
MQLLIDAGFLSCLLGIAWWDWRTGLIPDEMLGILVILGVIRIIAEDEAAGTLLLGASLAGGAFLLLRWASHGGIGWGDVKFACVLGLWMKGSLLFLAIWLAFLLGGIVGMIMLGRHHPGQEKVPFAPFLSLGTIVSFLYGSEIIATYWGLML